MKLVLLAVYFVLVSGGVALANLSNSGAIQGKKEVSRTEIRGEVQVINQRESMMRWSSRV